MSHSILHQEPSIDRMDSMPIRKRNSDTFNYIIVGGKKANIRAIRKTYPDNAVCIGRFGKLPIGKVHDLGLDKDLIQYLRHNTNIHKIIYIDSELDKKTLRYLVRLCTAKSIELMLMPQDTHFNSKAMHIKTDYGASILIQKRDKIAHRRYRILKRAFDIIFSALVIIFILSWMIPLVTLLIKLESRGPVFFIQARTGYFNSHFPCIKFRSMQVNEESDEQQASKLDYRITRIGAFLRRTNIDEFPQFINVFLGQMSVVGPRPHMLKHTQEYSNIINEFMIRHSVKPGITGWAQVNGHRGPTETVEKMRIRVEHDIWYIKNWSFFLDLKCIFMTIINCIKGEENAF